MNQKEGRDGESLTAATLSPACMGRGPGEILRNYFSLPVRAPPAPCLPFWRCFKAAGSRGTSFVPSSQTQRPFFLPTALFYSYLLEQKVNRKTSQRHKNLSPAEELDIPERLSDCTCPRGREGGIARLSRDSPRPALHKLPGAANPPAPPPAPGSEPRPPAGRAPDAKEG